jgi:septal ring factor EnvC (AmiA/AmiB activator)
MTNTENFQPKNAPEFSREIEQINLRFVELKKEAASLAEEMFRVSQEIKNATLSDAPESETIKDLQNYLSKLKGMEMRGLEENKNLKERLARYQS